MRVDINDGTWHKLENALDLPCIITTNNGKSFWKAPGKGSTRQVEEVHIYTSWRDSFLRHHDTDKQALTLIKYMPRFI